MSTFWRNCAGGAFLTHKIVRLALIVPFVIMTAFGSDGDPWQTLIDPSPISVPSSLFIKFAHEKLFVGGVVSSDLKTWQTNRGDFIGESFRDVFAVGDVFFGMGQFPYHYEISADGVKWDSSTSLKFTASDFKTFTHGNGIFAASGQDSAGQSGTWTSTDFRNWEIHPKAYGDQIIFAGGKFFATSYGATNIKSSADCVTWADGKLFPPDGTRQAWIQSIAYGNGEYIATGGVGMAGYGAFHSKDGIDWRFEKFDPAMGRLSEIVFVSGRFWISMGHEIDASGDGMEWRAAIISEAIGPQRIRGSFQQLTVAFGRIIAIESRYPASRVLASAILEDPIQSPKLTGQAAYRLVIEGTPGRIYAIEASEDAKSWSEIGRILLPSSPWRWVDPEPVYEPAKLYRAVLIP